MVNNSLVRLVNAESCKITQNDIQDRAKIVNGPVYDLDIVKDCLKQHGLFVLNESAQNSQINEFSPELTDSELIDFINELTPNDRIESERCLTSVKRTVDCDAYAMKWNRHKRCRWEHGAKIYVKFGFIEHRYKVLIISIHPSRY